MFKPKYHITNATNNHIAEIAEARAIVLHAPLIPKWEIDLRKEAILRSTHASTSIEGNKLSFEEVSDLMIGRDVTALRRDKQEVLNYFEALKYLDSLTLEKKQTLTNEDILILHDKISKGTLEKAENCGKYRSGKQYVIVGNRKTGEITFRPPATSEVAGLMNNLLNWINNPETNKINAVIEAGLVHYEFVRIHPFVDGNGRTARALATLILLRRNFDTKRFFTLDDFYNSDRPRYYEVLKSVNPKTLDLTDWVEYFCEGVNVSLKAVKDKVLLLTGGLKRKKEDKQIAIDERQVRVIELLRKQGKITNSDIQDLLKVSNKTVYGLLEKLMEVNLIKKDGKGRAVFYTLK
jgi:Fic family protein